MMRLKLAIVAGAVAGSAAFAGAQTVSVTPSNPQGWAGTTYYGQGGTGTGTGASAAITTTYPRSGTGSVEIDLPDAASSEADWEKDFATSQSLSSLTSLQYDWIRSSTSTTNGIIMPAFALHMSDGSDLIYERAYNASGDAPVDQWTTENVLNGNSWTDAGGTGNCSYYGYQYQTLSYFNNNCYGGQGAVTGIDVFLGYTQAGSFYGAVDNITIGANDATPTTYNFEPDITTTPEPGSLALLGTGLVALVPMVRRRRRA